jgi:hypothetical protein
MKSFKVKLENQMELKISNKEDGLGSNWYDVNILGRERNHIL